MASGFILINKKEGVTSRSVDNKIQRLFHTRKVGHLGTLDPFASGLLVIAVDKGCKSLPFIDDSYKTYQAKLLLGKKTSSGDLTTEVIEEKDVPNIDVEDILEVFESFIGENQQIPPMTSAIHINGTRLYDLSRKGIEVNRPSRKIDIKYLKLISFNGDLLEFEVNCSRGTYVRTLGEDIASKLGTVGHLIALKRTSIGQINLDNSKDIDDIDKSSLINPIELISLKHIVITDEKIIKDIKDGKDIHLDELEEKILLCYYFNNELIALAVYNHNKEDIYSPIRGLW